MNTNALKLRNKLYKIGLTDEDFERISAEFENAQSGKYYFLKKGKFSVGVEEYHGNKDIILTMENVPVPGLMLKEYQLSFDCDGEARKHLANLFSKYSNYGQSGCVKSLEEARNTIIRLLGEQAYERERIKHEDIESHLWLFDKGLPAGFEERAGKSNGNEIREILLVFEHDNVRYALTTSPDSASEPLVFCINVFTPDSPEYNYIDECRLFHDKYFLWDIQREDVNTKILDKIGYDRDFVLVDSEMYRQAERRLSNKVRKEEEENALQKELSKQAEKQLENLDKTPFVFCGIKFSKDCIEYNNQKLAGTWSGKEEYNSINSFRDFIKRFVSFEKDNLDFNYLLESFCFVVESRDSFAGILGTVPVELRREASKNNMDMISRRTLLNGIRVNKDDVESLLCRAICFDNAEDYNQMLRKVSRCNLSFHDLLANGLRFKYEDAFLEEEKEKMLHFPVVRKKNINFMLANGKEYRISDTNKLLLSSVQRKRAWHRIDMEHVMNLLIDVLKVDAGEVAEIFEAGLEEYREAMKRSKELLDNTIKVLGIKQLSVNDEEGYLITGKSGKQYFLTREVKVYEYRENKLGRYICIVDKSISREVHNDKLVSRMFALANDELVAKEIYTIAA